MIEEIELLWRNQWRDPWWTQRLLNRRLHLLDLFLLNHRRLLRKCHFKAILRNRLRLQNLNSVSWNVQNDLGHLQDLLVPQLQNLMLNLKMKKFWLIKKNWIQNYFVCEWIFETWISKTQDQTGLGPPKELIVLFDMCRELQLALLAVYGLLIVELQAIWPGT